MAGKTEVETMNNKNVVLIFMPTLFVGGSEKQVRYIIEGLEASKKMVTVLVENGSIDTEENRNYINEHPGVDFVFLKENSYTGIEKTVLNKMKSVFVTVVWICKHVKKKEYLMGNVY